ncbi:unnamed protein product [Triticum turgidum subsp. durum]|uniref:Uncharacterized protein n=1 Tax=Triticum turgidum subsp. durum TaxID=4567 RepID=A0A9R0YCY7_TRITD|nr:unnamed protein product [Triticum turgidum subsp. durum]
MDMGSSPTSESRNSDLHFKDSFDFPSTAGYLRTTMLASASDHPNVFFKYFNLATIFSSLRNATACSACLSIPEPRGTPNLSAHATIARTRSGLVLSILGTRIHSLAISQPPSPHSLRNTTLGLTALSRSDDRRWDERLSSRRKFWKEPKRGR